MKRTTRFLERLFEFEYCSECGGDAKHHIQGPDMLGNPHAFCVYPPTAETDWEHHPVIKAFRKKADAQQREIHTAEVE